MFVDVWQSEAGAELNADIVIIGAGAVGLCMAVTLARAGRDVLLLEAGGEGLDPKSQAYFEAASWTGAPLEGLHLGRFRMLGGTTNFWGGQLLEFDPVVFEHRPWAGDVSWPLTRAELDPYYHQAFDLLGLKKRLADDEVWRRLSLQPPATEDLELFFTRWAPEPNLARAFQNDLTSLPNLRVALGAPVIALDVADGGRVRAARIARSDGGIRDVSANHVVLANGTVEIARLLLLPTVQGRAAPWSTNAWLGRGFADHVDCTAGAIKIIDPKRFHALFDNAMLDGLKYHPKIKLSAAAQRREQLLGVSAQFAFNSAYLEHLGNAKILLKALARGRLDGNILRRAGEIFGALRVTLPMVLRYVRHQRVYNPTDRGVQLRFTAEQSVLGESAIALCDHKDSLGMPIVRMNWAIAPEQIRTFVRFGELVGAFLEREGLARFEPDPRLAAGDGGFLSTIDDGNHQMGMARMAISPDDGVVGPELRVHRSQNLYVAGAAVFPTTGFANPTLTAISLGLRLAATL